MQIELICDCTKFHGGIRRVEYTQYNLPARDGVGVTILFPRGLGISRGLIDLVFTARCQRNSGRPLSELLVHDP